MFKSLLFITCLLFAVHTSAQNLSQAEIDLLILSTTADSTSTRAERQEDLEYIAVQSKKIKYKKGFFYAHMGLANINRDLSLEISTGQLSILDSMLQYGDDYLTDTMRIEYALTKGYILGASGDHLNQLEYYLIADSLCGKIENHYLQSFINQHLAYYYYKHEDYPKALKFTKSLIDYYQNNSSNTYSYLNSLINVGSIYNKINIPDSTIKYVTLAIDNGIGNFQDLGFPYLLLGKSYLSKKNYNKAKQYETLMYEAMGTIYNYTIDGVLAHNFSGDLALQKKQFQPALNHFQKALTYADSIHYDIGKIESNYNLVLLLLTQHNDSTAIRALEQFKTENDSLYLRKTLLMERQLLVQYETNKKELKIEQLKYKTQQQQNKIIAIFLSLIILSLGCIILIVRHRNKQKLANKKLEAEKLKQTIVTKNLELTQKDLQQAVEKIEAKARLIKNLKDDLKNQINTPKNIDDIMSILDQNYIDENNWAKIIMHFDALNNNFSTKIKERYTNVTNNDIRLLVLIKLGYSIKGIADVNNISEDGVKKRKQRLLKKLNIEHFRCLNELNINSEALAIE